uniref:Glycosyl hydrolase family 32 N-terminal domain-containing protein n=1 Tax=Magnetococcus massalia (strain MO-1) TaxID=451514 RepID=A0A1S7LL33_MAGMO|nr:Protein of unknown function [Candidatus Magnetococcus massalia]
MKEAVMDISASRAPFCLDPEVVGAFAVNTPLLIEHDDAVQMLFIAAINGDDHERNYDLWIMPGKDARPRRVLHFEDCVHNPWVLKEDRFYRLYITVMENASDPAAYRSSIRTFTSTDLVNWRYEAEVITGSEAFPEVEGVSVIRDESGRYVGYFTVASAGDKEHPRFSENYTIFYAYSHDGIHFGEWHWPEGLEPVEGESDRGLYKPNIYRVGPSDYACFVSVVPWLHRFHQMVYRSRDLKRWKKLGPWLPPDPGSATHALKATLFRGHLTFALRDRRFRTWIRTVPIDLTALCPQWKRYHRPFQL